MQEVDQHESSSQLNGRRKRQKGLYFTTKRVRERASSMRKKSNIVVRKPIDDLAETQNSTDLNDLDEDLDVAAREELDVDIYNNTAENIEVQDDGENEENEHIKVYEADENTFSNENEEDEEEDEDDDEFYCVSISLIYLFF
jgi:hypothetical protein